MLIPISKPDFKALAKTLFGKSCIYFVLVFFSPFDMEAADREGLQRMEAHTASHLSGRGPLMWMLPLYLHVIRNPIMMMMMISIAITSLWEERTSLSACRTFVRFALVWFCLFPLPLDVWEGLRFVIMSLP